MTRVFARGRTFAWLFLSLVLSTLTLRAQNPPPGSVPGTIVYSRAGAPDGTIWMAAGDGSADVQDTTGEWPRLSPDGRYLLLHRGNATYSRGDIYLRDLQTGVETRIYSNPDYVVSYDWTADSGKFYFD